MVIQNFKDPTVFMERDTFLSKFLRKLSIQLNYIPGGSTKIRKIFGFLSWLGVVEVALLCSRDSVLIFLDDDSDYIYIFGDFAAPAGKFRKQATLIFLLYLYGSLYSAIYLVRTQKSPKYQVWIKMFKAYDNRSWLNQKAELHRLYWLTTRIELIYSISITISLIFLSAVLTITFPPRFIHYTLAHQLLNIHGGYNSCSYWGISYLLFPSYGYLLGQRLDKISHNLNKCLEQINSNYCVRHQIKSTTIRIGNIKSVTPRKLINQLTKQLKQLHNACLFWSRISEPTFLISFINQALLLYLIFFVPMSTGFRCFLAVLGIFNFISGQCCHFFAGIYTQKKVSQ